MGKYFSKEKWSYMFYTITHPMDGYYWIRHREYGSVPIAILLAGLFVGNMLMVIGVLAYYLLFGFALSRLVYASFANGVFDKYLNPHIEGAPMEMGLRPRTDEDDILDDDEDDEDEEEI